MVALHTILCPVVLALLAAPLAAQELKTSEELRDLPARQAESQAKRDLSSLLEEFSGYGPFRSRVRSTIGDVWFNTEPRASAAPGMCEKDLVQLFYAPVEENRSDPRKARVAPRKIEASRRFAFLELPTEETLEQINGYHDGRVSPSADRRCKAAFPDEYRGWFSAPSEVTAVRGYLALQAARAAVESGKIEVGGCEECNEDSREHFMQSYRQALLVPKFTGFEQRGANNEPTTFIVDDGGVVFTVETMRPAYVPTEDNIKSLTLQFLIIVT